MKRIALAAATLIIFCVAGVGNAAVIDFTGGIAHLMDGRDVILNNADSYTDNVDYYVEDGFKFDFVGGYGTVGDYYSKTTAGASPQNDVVHAHWLWLSSMTIEKVDGGKFDLTYIDITSNTTVAGGQKSGNELSYIQNNAGYSMLLPSSDWGIDFLSDGLTAGDGVARLWLDANFLGVTKVEFTSQNAYCFGMDNFYIDEPPPSHEPAPPSSVPEPATFLLLGAGLIGLTGYGGRRWG